MLLGIKERDLEVIEVNHRHDMDTQLLKVLQEYLNQTTEPSWQHVASVLHHMGEISMADTIAKKYDVTITEIT